MRRTRQSLQGALLELLGNKPFEEISVQEITDAAEVNRATFYDHYVDKFALLEALIGAGFHRLIEERAVGYDGACPAAAAGIVRATCDYLSTMHAAKHACEHRTNVAALEDAAMIAAIRRVLAQGMARYTSIPEERRAMQSAAAAWALYGAVKEWLGTPNRPPADTVVPVIVAMLTPLLGSPIAEHAAARAAHGPAQTE